jgi:hypothetical protein
MWLYAISLKNLTCLPRLLEVVLYFVLPQVVKYGEMDSLVSNHWAAHPCLHMIQSLIHKYQGPEPFSKI